MKNQINPLQLTLILGGAILLIGFIGWMAFSNAGPREPTASRKTAPQLPAPRVPEGSAIPVPNAPPPYASASKGRP